MALRQVLQVGLVILSRREELHRRPPLHTCSLCQLQFRCCWDKAYPYLWIFLQYLWQEGEEEMEEEEEEEEEEDCLTTSLWIQTINLTNPRDHVRPDSRNHVRPDPRNYAHHDYRNAPFSGSHGHLLPDPRSPTHWDAPHPLDRRGPLPNPHERLSQEPHDLHVLGRSTHESSYPPQDYHHLCPHDSFYHCTGNAHNDLPELQDTHGSMQDVSPVAESSTTYNMDWECSCPLGYSDRDRYSPAVEYGYMREHRFPPHDDYNDRGHGLVPQRSGSYYNDNQAYGRGYQGDSSSNTQPAEYPVDAPAST
ncbi:uncharacterized protein F5891DRAFT_986877 [Suillus fuscotomentosus]|uniref:Uncharacterized protein n=1 Tax=Suillus fuscotomentosus TaxID=1912939 RepID=A0AAD4DT44_9AGAM|nr:uncharacterized protein F5891DRAFT_986877 [Suillus fuscotomentosus]KAG1890678.1 hypothetical protein F5891DRAFT_986877 [Suillus fuscotomentosus]